MPELCNFHSIPNTIGGGVREVSINTKYKNDYTLWNKWWSMYGQYESVQYEQYHYKFTSFWKWMFMNYYMDTSIYDVRYSKYSYILDTTYFIDDCFKFIQKFENNKFLHLLSTATSVQEYYIHLIFNNIEESPINYPISPYVLLYNTLYTNKITVIVDTQYKDMCIEGGDSNDINDFIYDEDGITVSNYGATFVNPVCKEFTFVLNRNLLLYNTFLRWGSLIRFHKSLNYSGDNCVYNIHLGGIDTNNKTIILIILSNTLYIKNFTLNLTIDNFENNSVNLLAKDGYEYGYGDKIFIFAEPTDHTSGPIFNNLTINIPKNLIDTNDERDLSNIALTATINEI